MFKFEARLGEIGAQSVLCVGDLMLDNFVYGEVTRISPEAPTPVLQVSREELVIGGAGNVARNVAALGARCIFVGVIGNDEAGVKLTRAFDELRNLVEPHLLLDAGRPTTRKTRYVSEHHSTHLLRADWESIQPVNAETENAIIRHVVAALPEVGAVVLSDYAKGVLTPRVIRGVIDAAQAAGKPVVVDPKGNDYSVYRGCTLITPNRKELAEATQQPTSNDDEIALAAEALCRIAHSKAALVTRSEEGMTLVVPGQMPTHVPSYPVKVRDVSGAGDTVIAVLSLMLAMGAGFDPAMRAANAAAAIVVGKRGTASVSLPELRSRILPASTLASEEKIIFDWAELDERVAAWRRQALRIGFTNGCFDLLHPGHVRVLTQARDFCDRLIVGLNSDASVRRLKGEGRPIQNIHARADVLAALEAVDLVAVFEQDTPIELIERIHPVVLVKGGDYTREQVVGHEIVAAAGGEIIIVDLLPGHSTTGIVNRSGVRRIG